MRLVRIKRVVVDDVIFVNPKAVASIDQINPNDVAVNMIGGTTYYLYRTTVEAVAALITEGSK